MWSVKCAIKMCPIECGLRNVKEISRKDSIFDSKFRHGLKTTNFRKRRFRKKFKKAVKKKLVVFCSFTRKFDPILIDIAICTILFMEEKNDTFSQFLER